MNLQKEIINATSEYFENNLDFLKLSDASKKYKDILEQISNQNMDIEKGRDDIHFDNGKALGTFWAALCLDDLLRTRQFIRGIDKAIKEKMSSQKPLHILYAGTGPYATLILPFIFRYSKEDIKYTFLEINPFSFQMLQKLILKLGLEDYDITIVNEDATKYCIDSNNEPDIIISETMQNALVKEQQVPIFLNLMNQVKNEVIFIPEKIELSIGLNKAGVSIEELKEKRFYKEKTVFEVSKEAIFPLNQVKKQAIEKFSFEKKQIVIDNEKLKGFNHLLMITEVQVYKDEKININDSGLTTPIFIKDIPENLKSSIVIDTQYLISSEPKLDYKITFSDTL